MSDQNPMDCNKKTWTFGASNKVYSLLGMKHRLRSEHVFANLRPQSTPLRKFVGNFSRPKAPGYFAPRGQNSYPL